MTDQEMKMAIVEMEKALIYTVEALGAMRDVVKKHSRILEIIAKDGAPINPKPESNCDS